MKFIVPPFQKEKLLSFSKNTSSVVIYFLLFFNYVQIGMVDEMGVTTYEMGVTFSALIWNPPFTVIVWNIPFLKS